MTLSWSSEAVADLEDILDYVTARNSGSAMNVAERIDRLLMTLKDYPRAGRYDADADCFEQPIPALPLLLIYTIDANAIEN